ncbi:MULTISPECIES: hypothetical protein [unclassified Streptomyces]|uniref:hypothetical protein n=1 Tax=unclassified Streptomyces TaxID=2593676 RepID=UPI00081B36F9|nr:hypothetical protein [Streptomyces sp. BvitLS-983]MYX48625.1 hypothetical protein [Streptomyces sp. SID8385]MYX87208.1 hypothetical protein [Streptomyces sp. SID4915]SCD99168.1 hypothetical protein GA0115250_133127 [Streptomyces sp. BvitLS-983]
MSTSTNTNREAADHALSYPEPPASSLWHRHGPEQPRPLTPAQQRRNRELLAHAQHSPRSRFTKPAA